MNRDEIRTEAIERVARRMAAPFDPGDEAVRVAEAVVDALGDLLPTETEAQRSGSIFLLADGQHVGGVWRRYVTEWREFVDVD